MSHARFQTNVKIILQDSAASDIGYLTPAGFGYQWRFENLGAAFPSSGTFKVTRLSGSAGSGPAMANLINGNGNSNGAANANANANLNINANINAAAAGQAVKVKLRSTSTGEECRVVGGPAEGFVACYGGVPASAPVAPAASAAAASARLQ